MSKRIHNFCAGPCTLPLSVLENAQKELLDFQNSGMSLMEISHRSKIFEPLHEETLALACEILAVPDDFQCLLLPGGASQQFVMTAINLLEDGKTAAFIDSGHWAQKAQSEAARIGETEIAWSGKDKNYRELPTSNDIKISDRARYLHITSNETIGGIQFPKYPEARVPLVIDASSDFYTRPIPWDACDIVYGGAQKNLAPAGIAVVFVRKTLLQDKKTAPKFLLYKTHADSNSLYNTPPTWQIYILNGVLKWMKSLGGVPYFQKFAAEKSQKLYEFIDKSDFYRNEIPSAFRSKTNVVFLTPNAELDTKFWQEAEKEGLSGLKGHRVVGGLRASIYNAMQMESVDALIKFMEKFAQENKA
ncbi:MAG: 3-phosphoserine/phosphohydroxythreonine transaminase [Cardiobacteriaceae bacterium]|nr:3-phosphoserine/phosphohydroxythreonine transaminase [Cardiobacteriaceae bacterium]